MLNPEEMSKITIAGPDSHINGVISKLHELKVMHIVDHKKNEFDIGAPLENANRISDLIVRIKSIISYLNKFAGKEKKVADAAKLNFSQLGRDSLKLEAEINSKTEILKEIEGKINNLSGMLQTLEKIESLGISLNSFTDYESIGYFLGYLAKTEGLEGSLKKLTANFEMKISEYKGKKIIALFMVKDKLQEAEAVLKKFGFSAIDTTPLKAMEGDVSEIIPPTESGGLETPSTTRSGMISEHVKNHPVKGGASKICHPLRRVVFNVSSRISIVSKKISSLENGKRQALKELKMLADKWLDILECNQIILDAEMEKAEAPLRFAKTSDAFVIKGWVPKKQLEKVIKDLEKTTSKKIYIQTEKIEEHDNVPIELKNYSAAKPFELFMKLYTLPRFNEIDPTFLVFLGFPLLFGFMLGDIGYGLTTLAIAWLLKKKMPKAAGFLNIIMWASAATIFFGALFGEFFGFEELFGVELPHILSRAHQIQELLILAVIVGIAHINLGIIVGFINIKHEHGLLAAIYEKGSWILLQLSVAVLALSYMKLLLVPVWAGYIGILASVVMLYKGEGIKGLVELPGIFSNMLSYARLMAIGLASVELALVINSFAEEFFKEGGFMIIAAVLLLVVGHIVNIGIGILGSFLHSLRLQYVEFFTKFFTGGGQEFKPFGVKI